MNARLFALAAAVLVAPAVAFAQPAAPIFKMVAGTVGTAPDGAPTIVTGQGSFTISNAPWADYLLARAGQKVEARLRVAVPGPAGGSATVVSVYRQIEATVQLPVGGAPMLAENRSNVFQVADDPWRGFLLNVVDQRVEARIEITRPGMFGGEARVLRLWREVKGKVIVAMDGGPVMISENRSNGYQVEQGDAFRGWLMARADESVTVRLEVVTPGPFGGRARVESADLGAVTGAAQASGVIAVNRSNLFQVANAPFKAIVAAAEGRTVTAEVRLVKAGMFGGEVKCTALLTKHEGAAPLQVVARPTLGVQPTLGRIAPGRTVRIVGATASHYKVALRAGVVGYVRKAALEVGATTGLVGGVTGQ